MTVEQGTVYTRAQSSAAHPQLDPMVVFETLLSAGVNELYPDFQGWFFGKVVPGLQIGERSIIPWMIDGKLAGAAICKRAAIERKLCTLWVSPDLRTSGVAAMLARDAFAWLGNCKPLFTVPEERSAEFDGLIKGWAFSRPKAYDGLYRTGRTEYIFNGPLLTYAH